MTTLAPSAADAYLKPPRLAKVSPVTVLHIRADNDVNGNPRRCFVVMTTTGRLVETIDEGYGGEGELRGRWPWFDHVAARGLGLTVSYAQPIYATPAEYRRWIKAGENLDTDSPDVVKVRRIGVRAERWLSVRSALVDIRRSRAEHDHRELVAEHEGRENLYGDTRGTVVYHRTAHLQRAMRALVRAGMVDRESGDRDHGVYRATETTPDLY